MLKRWFISTATILMLTGCVGGIDSGPANVPDDSTEEVKADSFDNPTQTTTYESCNIGDEEECYTGPAGTWGVGICIPGTRTCGGTIEFPDWGECVGEVTPVTVPTDETCNDGLDNDCNGFADDGSECPGGEDVCGDGQCTGSETYASCAEDCPFDGTQSVCGDGACTHFETPETCPQDCPSDGSRCGDGDCTGTETVENCPEDCESRDDRCGDGECDGEETFATCPADCPDDGTEGVCGDGACTHDETIESCPQDCPEDGSRCGDGACAGTEDPENCPEDCEPGSGTCGDGACTGDEDPDNCPQDCDGSGALAEMYDVFIISADMGEDDCDGIWGIFGFGECEYVAWVGIGSYAAQTDDEEGEVAVWNQYLFQVPTSLLLSQPLYVEVEEEDSFLTLSDDDMGDCTVQVTTEDLEEGELVVYCDNDVQDLTFEFVAVD